MSESRVLLMAAQRVRKEKLNRIDRFNNDLRRSPLQRRNLAQTAYEHCVIVEQVIEEMKRSLKKYRSRNK